MGLQKTFQVQKSLLTPHSMLLAHQEAVCGSWYRLFLVPRVFFRGTIPGHGSPGWHLHTNWLWGFISCCLVFSVQCLRLKRPFIACIAWSFFSPLCLSPYKCQPKPELILNSFPLWILQHQTFYAKESKLISSCWIRSSPSVWISVLSEYCSPQHGCKAMPMKTRTMHMGSIGSEGLQITLVPPKPTESLTSNWSQLEQPAHCSASAECPGPEMAARWCRQKSTWPIIRKSGQTIPNPSVPGKPGLHELQEPQRGDERGNHLWRLEWDMGSGYKENWHFPFSQAKVS